MVNHIQFIWSQQIVCFFYSCNILFRIIWNLHTVNYDLFSSDDYVWMNKKLKKEVNVSNFIGF